MTTMKPESNPPNAVWLAQAWVEPEVFELRPDYRALLVVAAGLIPGPSDDRSEALLTSAETVAVRLLERSPIEELPHVAEWRQAFKAFGAKPQKTRPSVEALLRRLQGGLPRVDRLTDTYNALSVAHIVPVGGEDVDRYAGPLRLVRATGQEPFDTIENGEAVIDHPKPGEVVWRDDQAVTCRCWNWRQCTRTRLSESTTRAIFILDALGPMGDEALDAARSALIESFAAVSPGATFSHRVLRRDR
jgi:DNA/RNA-binding domain of Phe-tRNA-synthetase-like protein